jgi:hypothetical protein
MGEQSFPALQNPTAVTLHIKHATGEKGGVKFIFFFKFRRHPYIYAGYFRAIGVMFSLNLVGEILLIVGAMASSV